MHCLPSALLQTLERIKGTVESGSYYEAQQMYKSVYHRHKARRQIQESYAVLHVSLWMSLGLQSVQLCMLPKSCAGFKGPN